MRVTPRMAPFSNAGSADRSECTCIDRMQHGDGWCEGAAAPLLLGGRCVADCGAGAGAGAGMHASGLQLDTLRGQSALVLAAWLVAGCLGSISVLCWVQRHSVC